MFDSREYAWAAWHLIHDGVYSQEPVAGPVAPALGREPLFPAVVAGMLGVLPGLDGISTDCLSLGKGCGYQAWRPALFFNGVFIGLTGVSVFLIVMLLGAGRLAAWLGGLHVWLNGEAARGREYLLSDHLALLLVALASLASLWAYRRGGGRWLVAGAAFAALTLTKAVFLWLVAPALAAALIGILLRSPNRARALTAWALFAVAYAAPVGSWMERNHAVGGTYALTMGRSATALSTREVFDHMTPPQYAAAFVYWTRAMGDGLAKKYFPADVWRPFEIDNPNGFYLIGQHRLTPEMTALVANGTPPATAEKMLESRMIAAILDRPLAFAASTLPLIWRGIWVDEFIVLSLPALIWLAWIAAFRRRPDVALAIGPGAFSLVFYALVSLNIPRYQLTAVPALAVAFGIGIATIVTALRARRGTRAQRSAAPS